MYIDVHQLFCVFQCLKNKIEKYEKLCFNMEQVMDHFPNTQVVLYVMLIVQR